MVVEIINITDAPGRTPTQVDIWNKTIDPGVSMKLPAELVDKKVRTLEDQGLIAIGRVPSWYATAKQRKGKSLSPAERRRRNTSSVSKPKVELRLAEEVPVHEEIQLKRQRR